MHVIGASWRSGWLTKKARDVIRREKLEMRRDEVSVQVR